MVSSWFSRAAYASNNYASNKKVGSHRVAKRCGGNGVNRGIRASFRHRPEAFSTFVRIASRQGRRHDMY
jgi:hypothetical protein